MTIEEMVEKFQCPGCVNGPDPKTCKSFYLKKAEGRPFSCSGHVLGTSINAIAHIALGLPKGFNRSAFDELRGTKSTMFIRLWPKEGKEKPEWNHLNIPVWAMEKEGFLFVRTYSPRVDSGIVDVIEGETLALVPQALDVSKFYEAID